MAINQRYLQAAAAVLDGNKSVSEAAGNAAEAACICAALLYVSGWEPTGDKREFGLFLTHLCIGTSGPFKQPVWFHSTLSTAALMAASRRLELHRTTNGNGTGLEFTPPIAIKMLATTRRRHRALGLLREAARGVALQRLHEAMERKPELRPLADPLMTADLYPDDLWALCRLLSKLLIEHVGIAG